MGGAYSGMMSNPGASYGNAYGQNAGKSNNSNIKDSISFSKINAKIKKRQMHHNPNGLQKSVNANPSRGMTGHGDRREPGMISDIHSKERNNEREGSFDGHSQQNAYMGSIKPAGYRGGREDSEAKENNYMIHGDKQASIGYGEANELASLNHNSS